MEYDESNINDEQLAAANDTETPNTSLVSNKTVEAEKSTTIHESIRTVEQKALSFILALHKKRNFTRKDVIDIQREIKSMYSQLEQLIRACAPAASDPQAQYTFDVMLSKISSLFDFIDTEHKLFKYLRDRDLMRKPQMFIIQRNGIINVDVNDDDFAQNSKACLVLMDLEFQIRKFLESDNVLEEMKQNVNTLMGKPNLCHYINGSTYQKIYAKYPDRTIIPIFFYADEFEINDPLSSHSKKHCICGLYYGYATLPEQYRAKLCNIFVAGAIKKTDIAEHGVEQFMIHVIEKFKEFELNGILININGVEQRVYIVLTLVQGDNLGIHQILKFSGSFSAKYYCRFCRRGKHLLAVDHMEYTGDLRNRENYELDVLQKQSESGLVANSIFNQLPSFHVVENLYADVMHDLYSTGVCYYGFVEIINYCINIKKYATLAEINRKRKSLNNYRLEQGLSRMPDMDETTIKSKKSISLKMTANEMYVFSIYFTFIFGPFFPPEDPVWEYATILIKTLDLINLPSFSPKDLNQLNSLVSKHHALYTTLFEQNLKPKQHFLTHYATIIKHSGPLKKISCFRYEARHRDFKQYFDNTSSRKNPCYTMCIKAGIFFTYDVVNNNFLRSDTSAEFTNGTWAEKTYFRELNTTFTIASNDVIQTTKSITYKNINYKEGQFLTVTFASSTEAYQIIDIIKLKKQLFLTVCQWTIVKYHEHYQAYEIGSNTKSVSLLEIDIFDGPPFALERVGNVLMFRRRTFAFEDIQDEEN